MEKFYPNKNWLQQISTDIHTGSLNLLTTFPFNRQAADVKRSPLTVSYTIVKLAMDFYCNVTLSTQSERT